MGTCLSATIAPVIHAQLVQHYLERSALSVVCDETRMHQLASCFSLKTCAPGADLADLTEGDIFVVGKGRVDISTVVPGGNSKTENLQEILCTKRPGDVLCLQAARTQIYNQAMQERTFRDALSQNMPGRKTKKVSKHKNMIGVVDTTELSAPLGVTLLKLDKGKLEKLRTKLAQGGSAAEGEMDFGVMHTLMETCIHDYLVKVPFLMGVDQPKLRMLSEMCHYDVKRPNSTVCKEGEEGHCMFVILRGTVSVGFQAKDQSRPSIVGEIVTRNDTCHESHLATLGPGDFFGEMSLVTNMPRMATVKAQTNCLFACVDRKDFVNFLKVMPKIGEELIAVVKDHMIEKLANMGMPFLENLSPDHLKGLGRRSRVVEMAKGHSPYTEGQVDSNGDFYMVVGGHVKITKKTGNGAVVEVGKIGAGGYFGELALLMEGGVRQATITCECHCVFLCISKEEFTACFDRYILAQFHIRVHGTGSNCQAIIDHKRGRDVFFAFLNTECATENLLFCEAVADFRENEDDAGDLREKALSVHSTFISVDAPQQVNIPAKMKAPIDESIRALGEDETLTVPLDVFKHAEDEVFKLMARDNFARFKKTDEFTDFIREMQPYAGLQNINARPRTTLVGIV